MVSDGLGNIADDRQATFSRIFSVGNGREAQACNGAGFRRPEQAAAGPVGLAFGVEPRRLT